ncbi:MAG: efflux RND transporter permease subunit, partial [Parabacteroides sp.]
AERSYWSWTESDNSQYLLLGLIIVIIFFTTSILFNSLKQPLAVIFVIPISYIGVFLTFYLFRLNFDQGGFASFVLLCGITVNASIYILNEYNQLRRRFPMLTPLRAYLKAWNAKITPILLTILSTILGFVPFLLGTEKEAFWFPLAAGTIGGLILSLLGIFVYLPLFALRGTGEDSFIPRSLQTH